MNIDKRLLELALKGLEVEKQRIESEIAALEKQLRPQPRLHEDPKHRKFTVKRTNLTAAGRKRLSDSMKARWASKNPPIKSAKRKAA